jgi:putative endonuclease
MLILKNILRHKEAMVGMKEHHYYVYILTRERNSVFYVGVTNNLTRRVYEHKNGIFKGFTEKYNVKMLVYYEYFEDINEAIYREKIIKKWKRKRKISAIESINPHWDDLYFKLISSENVSI